MVLLLHATLLLAAFAIRNPAVKACQVCNNQHHVTGAGFGLQRSFGMAPFRAAALDGADAASSTTTTSTAFSPMLSMPLVVPNTSSRRRSILLSSKGDSASNDDDDEHLEDKAQSPLPPPIPPTESTDGLSTTMVSSIRFYKTIISPLLPPACRFVPTCSQYGVQAIQEFGPTKGAILIGWRILRCSPLGGKGYDPPKWPPVFYTYSSY